MDTKIAASIMMHITHYLVIHNQSGDKTTI